MYAILIYIILKNSDNEIFKIFKSMPEVRMLWLATKLDYMYIVETR